jgi:hypothetical protein
VYSTVRSTRMPITVPFAYNRTWPPSVTPPSPR